MENIESKEEWKQIDDYDNYSVSSLGNVRNDKTMKILKGCKIKGGYFQVGLCKNSVQKSHYIHRLVAIAFIPNPDNKPCVDHRDNDKTDNRVKSLRWCTYEENQMNRQIPTNNTSGFKGIIWVESRQKWVAQIKVNGLHINLGRFDSKEDAVKVRQTRANEVFGVYVNSCENLSPHH